MELMTPTTRRERACTAAFLIACMLVSLACALSIWTNAAAALAG